MYARVISDVYDKSRDDFEMGGVDLGTLDLLKSVSGICDLLRFHAATPGAHVHNSSNEHVCQPFSVSSPLKLNVK